MTPAPTEAEVPGPHAYVDGELLVGFRDGATDSEKGRVHSRHGSHVLKRFEEIGVDLVKVPPGQIISTSRSRYKRERSVKSADPNYYRYTRVTPNDPDLGKQWGLRNTGQTVNGDAGVSDADVDASELSIGDAWGVQTGDSEPVVAVIDTGVDITHPDLAANIWTNPGEIAGNSVDDDGNGYVDDVNGWDMGNDDASVYDPGETCGSRRNDDHGTHVAGIAGAVGNNATGISGVNWQVKILPLKFMTKHGNECGLGADSDAIEAILYAAEKGADVINASWGGGPDNNALRQAFIAAGQGGVLFSAAAGNSADDLSTVSDFPPSWDLDNLIVVASSTNDDTLSGFSNFGGPTDLAAPGSAIYSTITGGSYAFFNGTSMAAPFVSGAIALLRAQYPHAGYLELKDRILENVDMRPAFSSPITDSGGRLNINRALRDSRPVIPSVIVPNGGEGLMAGSTQTVGWETNVPSGNPVSTYRVEFTPNALASVNYSNSFESGIGFAEPVDSEAPWSLTSSDSHSGSFSARSGGIGGDEGSWMSVVRRLSAPGQVSFWYRTSSEDCESAGNPVCGDYLRFYVDGGLLFQEAGIHNWSFVSFPVPAGEHTFSWSYQKDPLCPPEPECDGVPFGSDAVWLDDVAITGVENPSWQLIDTTAPNVTSTSWTVPFIETTAAKVRVCLESGTPCESSESDESNSTFSIDLPEPGVLVSESGGSTSVTEGGTGDSYSIALASQPATQVTVSIDSGPQLASEPVSVTFTPSNWQTPRTILVSALDDHFAEGLHSGTILHSASSADANYNGLSVDGVSVSIADNETSGVLVTEPDESTLATEGGPGDSYTIRLLSQPTSDVTITISQGAQVQVSPTSLVFSSEDWSAPKTVTVSAVDDEVDEPDPHLATIVHNAQSLDPGYDEAPILSVEVEIHDNDTLQVLPEGATHSGFTTFVLLSNPDPLKTATVDVTFLTPEGSLSPDSVQDILLGPRKRKTINVNEMVGGSQVDVATKILASVAPVVAEVSVHKSGSLASLDMAASAGPARSWIVPEGVTHSGFTSFVTIANPDAANDSHVNINYLTKSGGEKAGPQNFPVPAGSRRTISLNSPVTQLGCGCSDDVSTLVNVVGSQPEVVVGVSVHRLSPLPGGDLAIGGSLGVTKTKTKWVVAEGATHSQWSTFVLIANPGSSSATVQPTFLTPSGPVSVPGVTVPAKSRHTINVGQACNCQADVSTLLTSSTPIAVESTIQREDSNGFVIADSVGAGGDTVFDAASKSWLVAEGATHSGFNTFILLANPDLVNPTSASFTFLTADGPAIGPTRPIPAGGRITLRLNDFVTKQDVSTLIVSTGPVVVEMSIDRALPSSGMSKGRSLGFKLS